MLSRTCASSFAYFNGRQSNLSMSMTRLKPRRSMGIPWGQHARMLGRMTFSQERRFEHGGWIRSRRQKAGAIDMSLVAERLASRSCSKAKIVLEPFLRTYWSKNVRIQTWVTRMKQM